MTINISNISFIDYSISDEGSNVNWNVYFGKSLYHLCY